MNRIINQCLAFAALFACCLSSGNIFAGSPATDDRQAEVLRLLNQAFEIWLASPDARPALIHECKRFAKFGFRDEAVQCIERAIAAKPSTQAGSAVEAVMLEYLKAGEHDKGLALVKKFEGKFRADGLFLRWKDHVLDNVVRFYIAQDQIDRALEAAGLMTGELPKKSGGELNRPDIDKWRSYSMVAQHYAQNGEPQRGLDLLKPLRESLPGIDRLSLCKRAVRSNRTAWALEHIDGLDKDEKTEFFEYGYYYQATDQRMTSALSLIERWRETDKTDAMTAYAWLASASYDPMMVRSCLAYVQDASPTMDNYTIGALITACLTCGMVEEGVDVLANYTDEPFRLSRSVLTELGRSIYRTEQSEGANQAEEFLQSIPQDWIRLEVAAELAQLKLDAGDHASAATIIDELIAEFGELEKMEIKKISSGTACHVFARLGHYEPAIRWLKVALSDQLPGYRQSIRFSLAAKLLSDGKAEQCRQLLSDIEHYEGIQLRSPGREVIVRIAVELDPGFAAKVMEQAISLRKSDASLVIQSLVEQGRVDVAREFWLALVEQIAASDGDNSTRLVEICEAMVFRSMNREWMMTRAPAILRSLEQVFEGSPILLEAVASGFAVHGMVDDVFRQIESAPKFWNEEKLKSIYESLATSGQSPAEWATVSRLTDPLLASRLPMYQAFHELVVGNTTEAIRIADSLNDPELQRWVFIRCATQLQSPYIESLRRVDNWLDSQATIENGLVSFPVASELPGDSASSLYNGLPGLVFFYDQMHKVTVEPYYNVKKYQVIRSVVDEIQRATVESDPGLFTGYGGLGQTLCSVDRYRYHKSIARCIQLLSESAVDRQSESGRRCVSWNQSTDVISGSAGIGIFLLNVERTGNTFAFALAVAAGDGLLADASDVTTDDAQQKLRWMINPDIERDMPNYSHGTAGVCDFLLRLHQACEAKSRNGYIPQLRATYDGRFGKAAASGARYLTSLDARFGKKGLIPHHFPEGEELFYLGWCHGPPGTCQLANRMGEIAGQESWLEFSRTATREVLKSALHKNRTDGFWNNVGLCCGSAGVGSFLLDQGKQFNDERYREEARRMAADILARGTTGKTKDGRPTLCWPTAEHRTRPDFLQTQTGLMQGAAGVGLFLLQLEAEHQGENQFSLFGELLR